jgi:hypothetical protein
MSKGFKNSSNNISPGCVGGRCFGKRRLTSRLVVIDNFDLVGMIVLPFKTDPELLVDPDAVLIFPVAPKAFQTIGRRDRELTDFSNTIYLIQLALRIRPQRSWTATSRQPGVSAIKYVLCTLVAKGFYHGLYYNDTRYKINYKA